jgi:hypothetical protein
MTKERRDNEASGLSLHNSNSGPFGLVLRPVEKLFNANPVILLLLSGAVMLMAFAFILTDVVNRAREACQCSL